MWPYHFPHESESFKRRYPKQYAGFKELKKDIQDIINNNVCQKEVFVNGYAESGKKNAIYSAIHAVLNEMGGFEEYEIITWHNYIFKVAEFKRVDGKKHFILTFNKEMHEKYLQWAKERR